MKNPLLSFASLFSAIVLLSPNAQAFTTISSLYACFGDSCPTGLVGSGTSPKFACQQSNGSRFTYPQTPDCQKDSFRAINFSMGDVDYSSPNHPLVTKSLYPLKDVQDMVTGETSTTYAVKLNVTGQFKICDRVKGAFIVRQKPLVSIYCAKNPDLDTSATLSLVGNHELIPGQTINFNSSLNTKLDLGKCDDDFIVSVDTRSLCEVNIELFELNLVAQ